MGFWLRNRKWASSCVLGLFGPSSTRNVYYSFFDKNKLSAVFIVKFDWWLRVMRNKEWFSHGLLEIALKSRRECIDSCRIDVLGEFVRYVTYAARSLRSDRSMCVLGLYVAIGLCVCARSLRSDRALARARSLCSDHACLVRDPIVILELVCGRFEYVSVALGQSVFGLIEIRTRFYRKALCKDIFYEESLS